MKETIKIIYEDAHMRIESIQSHGEITAPDFWYDQDESEWVQVTKGHAILRFETHDHLMKQGESMMIQPHQRHQVAFTSNDCEWTCVYIKPE